MWQYCPDTQLGIQDPNRRQKEKGDVLKQRRRQDKLKEVLGFVICVKRKNQVDLNLPLSFAGYQE